MVETLQFVVFYFSHNVVQSSSSGYDSASRRALEGRKNKQMQSTEFWPRRNPYNFTGCLAHVEVTELESNSTVTSIVGHLEHDPSCQMSVMQ
jgi:hypothetical protein